MAVEARLYVYSSSELEPLLMYFQSVKPYSAEEIRHIFCFKPVC